MIKINSSIFDYRRKEIYNSHKLTANSSIYESKMSELKIKTCKICFENDEEINKTTKLKNLMISVCNCKGTLQYIHFECLSKWIESKLDCKIEYQTPICFKIILKNYYCELCKAELPRM